MFNSILLWIIEFSLICLVSTIILESFFAIVFRVKKQDLLIVVLAQIATNPIVVFASNFIYYSAGTKVSFFISLAVLEILAIIVEGMMYKAFFNGYKFLNPFVLSIVLNMISFFVGDIIYCFIS